MSVARARELAVLSLLAAHPAHGYEIARAMASGPLALLGLSRPAVYAILERFRTRGWVDEHEEAGGPYPDRMVLSLTPAAREALDKALAGLTQAPLAPTAPLLALTLALDSGHSLPDGALDGLIAARHAQIASWPDDPAHTESATGRLARRLVEAELSFLEELRAGTGEA